jgi:hypothetical protein
VLSGIAATAASVRSVSDAFDLASPIRDIACTDGSHRPAHRPGNAERSAATHDDLLLTPRLVPRAQNEDNRHGAVQPRA